DRRRNEGLHQGQVVRHRASGRIRIPRRAAENFDRQTVEERTKTGRSRESGAQSLNTQLPTHKGGNNMGNIVIAGYVRSPFTLANKGALRKTRPDDMAAAVVKGLLEKTKVDPA